MGCTYSADRKEGMVKGRIQPIDSSIRLGCERGAEANSSRPKYANNLRGTSIKEVSPRGDIIPGFTKLLCAYNI
jgi:hypothetical protein